MKTMPTLPQFKKWARANLPVARALILAQAFAEAEGERVNAYIQPIFDSFTFTVGADMRPKHPGERITDQDHLYLCTDEALVREYFDACDKAHRAHGFTGPYGHCPALIAHSLLIEAENLMIDAAYPLCGVENIYGENRTKYLDLLLGACLLDSDLKAADLMPARSA